jgi:modulator of FtsH protease HflK
MPWNQDDGNQGPWGQPPRNQNNRGPGNRGPSGLPPEFDEFLKRGKDNLKNAIPGAAGGRGSWLIPVVLLGVFWVYNSVYQVQADELGVVLRLGEYSETVKPGLHFAPWPIDTMEMPKVAAEQQIDIGRGDEEGLMLAGDQNIVEIQFTVLWRIADPEAFLFNVQAPQESLVQAIAESAMREVVGRTPAEVIRTTGRLDIQDQVLKITQETLDGYKAGVIVAGVKLEKADPPQQVIGAFEEVQKAEQNQAQLINEADAYRNQQVRLAEGEAAKLVEDAKAYKFRVVADAKGEAARFVSVYDEYKNAKDVTRRRLFLETMEQVLGQSNKVIMESGAGGAGGVIPYLPLPEVQKRASNAGEQQ